MGGYGSGLSIGECSKYTVDESYSIDIDWMRRQKKYSGNITWSRAGRPTGKIGFRFVGNDRLILSYTVTKHEGEKNEVDDIFLLETTSPHFGGKRIWLSCPSCGRRVKTLHKPPTGIYFRCRTCYNLTYQSCKESHKYDRMLSLVGQDIGMSLEQVKRVLSRWQK